MTPEITPEITNQLVNAIVKTVHECGQAPEGVLYVAFMQLGTSLGQFTALVNQAVATGKIRRSGHCLYPVGGLEAEPGEFMTQDVTPPEPIWLE